MTHKTIVKQLELTNRGQCLSIIEFSPDDYYILPMKVQRGMITLVLCDVAINTRPGLCTIITAIYERKLI